MTDTTLPATEPSDLTVAIRVGQKMLAAYGDSSGFDVFAFAQAHGGLAEALRILLRALGAEPADALPPALTELHRLCRDDYASSVDRRAQHHRDDAHLTENAPDDDPSVSSTGFRIMRQTEIAPGWWGQPTEVGETGSSIVAYNFCTQQNKVTLDPNRVKRIEFYTEPLSEDEAARASVDRAFPAVAAFLADEPADQAQAADRCGRCRWTFDPYDKRSDGHARHADSPYCRRCVDNCHDGGTDHVCVICDPKRYGGAR